MLATPTFEILSVCSGNVCRSPVAEQLLRSQLKSVPGLTFSSSGTIALVGEQMPQEAQRISRDFGGDPSLHTPRQLTESQVAGAQFVLAMAREHRRAIVTLVPRSSRYTFTLREFARLSAGLTPADLASLTTLPQHDTTQRIAGLIELVGSRRGMVAPPERPEDDDVVDPYRREFAVYERSGRQIADALASLLRVVRMAVPAAMGPSSAPLPA